MPDPAIRIEGLAELRKAFKYLEQGDDLKELQRGLKAAAGIVASEAKRRAGVFSSRAAATIRPGTSGNKAYVAGGKQSLPWYGWADFGSRIPVQGNPRSKGPWAGSGKGPVKGRFIYPAIDATSGAVVREVENALDVATRKVGLT